MLCTLFTFNSHCLNVIKVPLVSLWCPYAEEQKLSKPKSTPKNTTPMPTPTPEKSMPMPTPTPKKSMPMPTPTPNKTMLRLRRIRLCYAYAEKVYAYAYAE